MPANLLNFSNYTFLMLSGEVDIVSVLIFLVCSLYSSFPLTTLKCSVLMHIPGYFRVTLVNEIIKFLAQQAKVAEILN